MFLNPRLEKYAAEGKKVCFQAVNQYLLFPPTSLSQTLTSFLPSLWKHPSLSTKKNTSPHGESKGLASLSNKINVDRAI